MTKKANLNTTLQKVINDCYKEGCNHLGIINYKKVIFKGFYSEKLFQEVIANKEITNNLQITNQKLFAEYVYESPQEMAGTTWPLNKESWITLNNSYEDIDDFLDVLLHETAHAILFNVDLEEGHSERHKKLTWYLIDYFHKKYDWRKIEKLLHK